MDFLYLQRSRDTNRIKGFQIYHSDGYNSFVFLSIVLNLLLSFFEAPASKLDYVTIANKGDKRGLIIGLQIASLVFYSVDIIFSLWLFGIWKVNRSKREAVKVAHDRGEYDDILETSHTAFRNSARQEKQFDLLTALRIVIWWSFVIDMLLPTYTTGSAKEDMSVNQIVFLLPYSAMLRPSQHSVE